MPEIQARKEYDSLATVYDLLWRSYERITLSFLQTWIQLLPGDRVLDVACGTGIFEQFIVVEHPTQQLTGIDLSFNMLTVAARKCRAYPTVIFQQGRADALPLAAHQFDVVVCANAFHYFDHPGIVLREMRRVLKPAGRVVILDWCRDFLVCRVCDAVLHLVDPAHHYCYTQAEFHALLEESGFIVHAARRMRFGAVWGLMVATVTPYRGQGSGMRGMGQLRAQA